MMGAESGPSENESSCSNSYRSSGSIGARGRPATARSRNNIVQRCSSPGEFSVARRGETPSGLDGLNGLERLVKGAVELPILSDAAPHDRLKVRQIGDVNDLVHALHKRAHGIVRGKTMAEKNDEILAS